MAPCDRCGNEPATTHQEYRGEGDHENWANRETARCDRCAQDLRDYTNLPGISLRIVVDRRLVVA